jgi:ATP phosphoribosyltransferase
MSEKLRIAIPNKGRMRKPAIELLKSAGLKLNDGDDKALFIKTNNPDIDIIAVRMEDIPEFVEDGAADIGVVGKDVVAEKGVKVKELMSLNFGYCSLVLAAKKDSGIKSVGDLKAGTRVATKFVNLTKKYFKENKKDAEIIQLSGAVEVAPVIGLADVIVDLTSTGSTLRTHDLKVVDTLLESQAILVGNKDCSGDLLDDLLLALKGVVFAEKKKYLLANLPENRLKSLENISMGALSPTVTKLDRPGWISVQMVVEEKEIFGLIKKLKRIGGRDILVLPIERLVK